MVHVDTFLIFSDRASDILSLVLGTLNCATSDSSRKDIVLEDGGLSMISVPPQGGDEPAFDITAIIEPLSRGAQKILPILLVSALVSMLPVILL